MKNLELHYQLRLHDLSGSCVLDTGLKLGHSFTVGFSKLMFNWFAGGQASPETVTNTSGASVTKIGNMLYCFFTTAGSTTTTYGIQVGTSTAAESISDAALGSQIAHGTSAGQLQYGSMTYAAPSTTASTTTFRHARVFTNGSGGTVTVQEIGLVGGSNPFFNQFLLVRDLTGAIAVSNGQQLTVNYDFTTTI